MTEVCSRSVMLNFKYAVKALSMFNSRIVLNRIHFEH